MHQALPADDNAIPNKSVINGARSVAEHLLVPAPDDWKADAGLQSKARLH
jgi:hypothetical protein